MISYNASREPTKGSGGPSAACCPSFLDGDRATELSCAAFSASFSGFSLDPLPAILLLFFFFLNFLKNLFIYLWLCWVFVSVQGLSLVAASGGHSSSRCAALSLSRPLLLWSTGSRRAGSVIVAHGPSCSAACGIFPEEGSNPCPLHWQADSQPLRHQGSPILLLISSCFTPFLNVSFSFFFFQ